VTGTTTDRELYPPRAEREGADRKTVRELAELRPGKLGSTK